MSQFGPPTADQVEAVYCYVKIRDREDWAMEGAREAFGTGEKDEELQSMKRARGWGNIANQCARAIRTDPPPGFNFMHCGEWLEQHTHAEDVIRRARKEETP